jgi:hypothetical protein
LPHERAILTGAAIDGEEMQAGRQINRRGEQLNYRINFATALL